MEQMREEFEEWAVRNQFITDKMSDGRYAYQQTNSAWLVWQASKATQVVELPHIHTIDGYFYVDLALLEHALEQAGVKYK